MPSAPLRFCATPQCDQKVRAGHCPKHQQARRQARVEDPRYGTERWRRLSEQVRREEPFCFNCQRLTEVADHIVPVIDAPDRFFDRANLRGACQDCNKRRVVNAFGRLDR